LNRLVKILNFGIISIITAGIIISVFVGVCLAEQESVSLTSYYPAPYAKYKNLRLHPQTEIYDCDSTIEGRLEYYDAGLGDAYIRYCSDADWQDAAGLQGIHWEIDEDTGIAGLDGYLYTKDSDDPATNWQIGIGKDEPYVNTKLHLEGGGFLFTGDYILPGDRPLEGVTPVEGAGTRFMWIPASGAFRAGFVGLWGGDSSTYWDDENIGDYSFSVGMGTYASGNYSTAFGSKTAAIGEASFAAGHATIAEGDYSFTSGRYSEAYGFASFASGYRSKAFGNGSVASGMGTEAGECINCGESYRGHYSFAAGCRSQAIGESSIALRQCARAEHDRSVAIGLEPRVTDDNCTSNTCNSFCETDYSGQFRICGDLKVAKLVAGATTRGDGIIRTGSVSAGGTIYVGGIKGFKIPHPDSSKPEGTYLIHASVEGPTAGDNIYRWTVEVVNGEAEVELPGYYKFLNKDDMVCITAKGHLGAAYGEVDEAQEKITIRADADGKYNVLLIGTRKDPYAAENWQGPEVFVKSE